MVERPASDDLMVVSYSVNVFSTIHNAEFYSIIIVIITLLFKYD